MQWTKSAYIYQGNTVSGHLLYRVSHQSHQTDMLPQKNQIENYLRIRIDTPQVITHHESG